MTPDYRLPTPPSRLSTPDSDYRLTHAKPTPLSAQSTSLALTERVIYWEEEKALILSDLHLGKTGHFRKSGIAVPQQVYKNDLHRLVQSIQHFQPKQLIIVGDMFHSHANKEHDWFLKWRNDFSHIEMHLVEES